MSVLAPWMLAGAAAAAAMMVALHFIAWDRPHSRPLPTARFVPEPREVPAARRRRLVDQALLALRVLAILLIGIAFARPVLTPSRRGAVRVVVLDRSRGVADTAAARDSARAWRRSGDLLLVVDSTTGTRGSLSAALIGAIRAAAATRARPESSEIVLVSPMLAEEVDAATSRIRGVWPGSMQIVRVAPRRVQAITARGALPARGTGDDPVVAAARLVSVPGRALVVRGLLTPADSTFARDGGTLVHWPVTVRGRTVGALVGARAVAVASFVRPADAMGGDDIALRWADGSPAATESPTGDGCIRTVRAGVPDGDQTLHPQFLGLLSELAGACASHVDPAPAPDSVMSKGTASERLGDPFVTDVATGFPLATWLFAGALLSVLAELLVRRQR